MTTLDVRLDHSSTTHFQSIFNRGLLPASALKGSSFIQGDTGSSHLLCCNFFHPNKPDETDHSNVFGFEKQSAGPQRIQMQLESLVFQNETGMLPIATEKALARSFATDEDFLCELTSRVQNTVCFILSPETYQGKTLVQKCVYGNLGTPYETLITHYEIRHPDPIKAQHIVAALAPFHLVASIQRVFQKTIVIPVPDCYASVNLGIFCNDTAPSRKEAFQEHTVRLISPDYKSALNELIVSHSDFLRGGFYTHLTRVPPHILPDKKKGQKKFAVRFTNAEVEKVLALQDQFLAIKNPAARRLNEFYVLCDKEQEEKLRSIIS